MLAADRGASQGECEFLVSRAGCLPSFFAVELQSFAKHNPQRFKQLLAVLFLGVHAKRLLNPLAEFRCVKTDFTTKLNGGAVPRCAGPAG